MLSTLYWFVKQILNTKMLSTLYLIVLNTLNNGSQFKFCLLALFVIFTFYCLFYFGYPCIVYIYHSVSEASYAKKNVPHTPIPNPPHVCLICAGQDWICFYLHGYTGRKQTSFFFYGWLNGQTLNFHWCMYEGHFLHLICSSLLWMCSCIVNWNLNWNWLPQSPHE